LSAKTIYSNKKQTITNKILHKIIKSQTVKLFYFSCKHYYQTCSKSFKEQPTDRHKSEKWERPLHGCIFIEYFKS